MLNVYIVLFICRLLSLLGKQCMRYRVNHNLLTTFCFLLLRIITTLYTFYNFHEEKTAIPLAKPSCGTHFSAYFFV